MKEIDSVIDVPIKDRIEQYFRSKVLNEANLEGGFNNRLFKISLENGMDLLLKQYFDDERNRLNREYRAFEYLKKLGEMHIPTPLFRDDKDKFAVYSYFPNLKPPA